MLMSKSTVQYPRVTPTNKGAGNEGYNAPWSNVVTSEKARLIIVPTLLNKVSLRPTTPCDYPSQTIYQVFRLSMRQGFPTDKHKQNKSSNRESESSNLDIFLSLCIYISIYILCIYIYLQTYVNTHHTHKLMCFFPHIHYQLTVVYLDFPQKMEPTLPT
jgi:hypothetical protein